MTNLTRYQLAVIISMLTMLITGCTGNNVQVARIPFISPVVVPDLNQPQEMLMNIGVQNYGTKVSPGVWMEIRSEYGATQNGGPPCTRDDWFPTGALTPNQGWGLKDYRIDGNNKSCQCLKNSCPGHLWASLHVASNYGPILPGPGTNIHVNWVASGDLAQQTIIDCSAPPNPIPAACQ